jgi:hypothetical protein
MMKNLRIIFLSMIVLLIVQPLFAQPFCNLAQDGAGFPTNLTCEVSVCDDDPFCCETAWDGVCADTANEDPNCLTCLAFCNETYGNAGFAANTDCETAVCAADGFCCATEWDGICADIAYSEPECASCITPFCSESQGTPGFPLTPECEAVVCAADPFCCDTSWDGTCALGTLEQPACASCFTPGIPFPPCGLEIPADAFAESEDCGEDTNGGCNMDSPSFDSIYCGQTFSGTAWADDGSRDTDWYLFTLATAGEVTISGSAEFPFLLGLISDFTSCDDFDGMIDEAVFGEFCGSESITVTLDAGTHILFFAPSEFEDYPCEGENINYFVSLESDHCPEIFCNQAQTFPGFPTNLDCQDEVCAIDPFCCSTAWDGICANTALDVSSCADCIVYCDQPTGTPGFPADTGCEVAVCAEDPFCCDTAWDGVCADIALGEPACADCLSPLPEPCEPFEVPLGATMEMETCGEDTNGGCNSDPNEFGSVSCGETIHGTAWSSVESRDTDWYQFTLTEEAEVTMTGSARFEVLVAFINECNVGDGQIPVLEVFESCEIFTVSAVLPAGNYSAFVAPANFVNNPCESGLNDYYFTLDIASETPEISIDGDLAICPDESVVLSAPTGSAYEWAPGGEITQSITVSSAGTYSVTVTDGNGCVNTSGDVVVTENDAPTAVLSGGGTVCDGSSVGIEVNFTGTSPWSFTITDGDLEFTFDNVVTNPWMGTVGEIGTWTISALSDANCSGTATGSAEVVEDCPCDADAGMLEAVGETDCLEEEDGSTVMLTASHTMDPVVPAGYETVYVLTEGAGLVIIDVNTDDPEFSVDAEGDYTIHTLVYDPATLDLEIVEIGTTTGIDVNSLLEQGGGDICGALDVAGASFTVEDCLPTGISDFSDGNLQVFPNPSNGQFVIQLQSSVGQGVIRVVDISGRQVFHREIFLNSRFRTDVELNVAPGTYILQIIAPEGTATRTLEVL